MIPLARLFSALVLIPAALACSAPVPRSADAPSAGTPPVSPAQTPAVSPLRQAPTPADRPAIPESAQLAVSAARRELATELGIPGEQITVSRVEMVEWPTSALGCPQPGRVYLQVITPGYRILLAYQGAVREYHTDAGGRVVMRCG